jgi:cytochrome c oxidase cbb3-type subunit 3
VNAQLTRLTRTSRRNSAPSWFALVALAVLPLAGCDRIEWGKPSAADRPVPPNEVLQFGALFNRNCAGCHGADGKLGPAPPLNDSLFRALVPQSELERVVSAGRPGTPMPAFAIADGGTLTSAQIRVLVNQIKGVPDKDAHEGARDDVRPPTSPTWGVPKSVNQDTPSYLSSAAASIPSAAKREQIRKTVFNRACAGCHGERGEGGSGAGPINDPVFLALTSDQALRRIIITGRPDLEMPDYRGSDGRDPDFKPLTSEEIKDLVDLLASWRRGASDAGEAEARVDK